MMCRKNTNSKSHDETECKNTRWSKNLKVATKNV